MALLTLREQQEAWDLVSRIEQFRIGILPEGELPGLMERSKLMIQEYAEILGMIEKVRGVLRPPAR